MANSKKTRGFQLRSGNTSNSPNKSILAIAAGALTGGLSAVYGKAGGAPPSNSKGPRFDNDEERGFNLKSGNTPLFKMMGSKSFGKGKRAIGDTRYKRDEWESPFNMVPVVNPSEENNESKENKEVKVTETDASNITDSIVNPPKVNKAKTVVNKIGNTLVGAFTSGLDAVYGQGKVIPGDKVKFHDPKDNKDEKTGQEKVDELINKDKET